MNLYQAKCAEALMTRRAEIATQWVYSPYIGSNGGWGRDYGKTEEIVFQLGTERWARLTVRHRDGATLREAFYATRDEALKA